MVRTLVQPRRKSSHVKDLDSIRKKKKHKIIENSPPKKSLV
jgi:hypothetical protein